MGKHHLRIVTYLHKFQCLTLISHWRLHYLGIKRLSYSQYYHCKSRRDIAWHRRSKKSQRTGWSQCYRGRTWKAGAKKLLSSVGLIRLNDLILLKHSLTIRLRSNKERFKVTILNNWGSVLLWQYDIRGRRRVTVALVLRGPQMQEDAQRSSELGTRAQLGGVQDVLQWIW